MCLPVCLTELSPDNILRTSSYFLTKYSTVMHYHEPGLRAKAKTKEKQFAIFMATVKVRFKMRLFRLYLLTCCCFCKQTYVNGSLLRTEGSRAKTEFLCSSSRSQQRLHILIADFPVYNFWIAKPFVTKLGIDASAAAVLSGSVLSEAHKHVWFSYFWLTPAPLQRNLASR